MNIRLLEVCPADFATVVPVVEAEKLWLELKTAQETVRLEAGSVPGMTVRRLRLLWRRVVAIAREHRVRQLATELAQWQAVAGDMAAAELVELAVTNALMASYAFVKYKTPPKEGWPAVEELVLVASEQPELAAALQRGVTVAEAVNWTRDLANMPPADMGPADFAAAVQAAADGLEPVEVRVLGQAELEELGAGGILGVCRGSAQEPKLVVVEYKGAAEPPVVLVGKGVMFDSGGLNVKPGDSMTDMHMDMSGGAAVVGAVLATARLGLKKHVVAIVPAVENMPSGSSYHPGDVLRTMSGKTIEVLNTDAEGRVILADGLTYAGKFEPRLVVDVATLTGAAMSALGRHASAVFAVNDGLRSALSEWGEASGDYVWPLPLWDEYDEEIKGTFGDWANIGSERLGGAIHAAAFLKQFAPDVQHWAHIDIAPRMTPAKGEFLAKGAAGAPVRLLVRLLEEA